MKNILNKIPKEIKLPINVAYGLLSVAIFIGSILGGGPEQLNINVLSNNTNEEPKQQQPITDEEATKEKAEQEQRIADEKAIREKPKQQQPIDDEKAIKEKAKREQRIANEKARKEKAKREQRIANEKARKEKAKREQRIANEKARKEKAERQLAKKKAWYIEKRKQKQKIKKQNPTPYVSLAERKKRVNRNYKKKRTSNGPCISGTSCRQRESGLSILKSALQ